MLEGKRVKRKTLSTGRTRKKKSNIGRKGRNQEGKEASRQYEKLGGKRGR